MGVGLTEETKLQIDDGVRRAAYRIIEGKGATYYGIGRNCADCAAIRDDERRVLTVSSLTTGAGPLRGVCLSLPRVLGLRGVLANSGLNSPARKTASFKKAPRS